MEPEQSVIAKKNNMLVLTEMNSMSPTSRKHLPHSRLKHLSNSTERKAISAYVNGAAPVPEETSKIRRKKRSIL